jgi:formamidopyrimidine-DNA glycosylase
MPELPEVETIKRDIEKNLIGKKILDVWTDSPKQVQPSLEEFKKATIGKKFKDVKRRAKILIFHLEDVTPIIVHLKLSGRFLFRNQTDKADAFTRITIKLDKGKEIRFADLRRFGWIKLLKDENNLNSVLDEFGIEPFTPNFTLENFKKIISSKPTKIKPLIMDQKQIAGVGNIYSDESLWCAKIHSERMAKSLSETEIKKLYDCILESLKQGIADRGTSVDQYVDLQGQKGKHEQNLQVFRKNGKPCPRCRTIIRKIRVGGRGTHYCPACQKL